MHACGRSQRFKYGGDPIWRPLLCAGNGTPTLVCSPRRFGCRISSRSSATPSGSSSIEGIQKTFTEISPIEDYTGSYAVEFGEHRFEEPPVSMEECMSKDKTFAAPLFVKVRFIVKETGEVREQDVFIGDFPLMTESGTFIINGTERVVVTQLVRSPGAYVMEPKDATKQVLTASLMPSRGLLARVRGRDQGLRLAGAPPRQLLQPEATGATMEVTKSLKPSVKRVTTYGDSASVQAVTRVNAEQASKRTMRGPTRLTISGKADTTG